MSLKAFHIFFITIATLLVLSFGTWQIIVSNRDHSASTLGLGIGSLICGLALIVYGRWFLHKLKGVNP